MVLAVVGAALLAAALPGAAAARVARFSVGAAVGDFTPPRSGAVAHDPADCVGAAGRGVYTGRRTFAFEEPYVDAGHSGHYDAGDPYVDCNADGRWDGNLLGGGGGSPRFYDHVLDQVGARALVVSNGRRTIAVEVVDQEGLFNVYQQRIRQQVARDGYHLDGIFVSATHDESAPDSLGLSGVNQATSSVNPYFVDYLVDRSAQAIERAYRRRRAATIRYAEAIEPANLRQCWSSYPFVDDQLMPILQARDRRGRTIATLGDVSQHAETLGFNPDAGQAHAVSSDWPHFFRAALERHYGGVGIEMAGSVGSVESPEVFGGAISRVPQRFVDEDHPAGCRTLFGAPGKHVALGYRGETRAFGLDLAGAVQNALGRSAHPSRSATIGGARADICVPVDNVLFQAGGLAGVFAARPVYTANCKVRVPPVPNGSTEGTELLSQVATFRIGDGSFVSVPGEVFPLTYLRSFQGPGDEAHPGVALPPWLMPHLHTPYRFVDGLAEDMIGYIFPAGNAVGIPTATDPGASGRDRFGCGHSDDSESASAQAGNIVGRALVRLLDAGGQRPERVLRGRYVLPSGRLSRDPLGGPQIKCDVDRRFHFAGRAVAVWLPAGAVFRPRAWLSLSGRTQREPDRNTRGYIARDWRHRWLDVFPRLHGPRRVRVPPRAGHHHHHHAAGPRFTG